MEEMRIYIANLGKYNEGELVGEMCIRDSGNLEFAGEDKTEQRRINGRMAVLSRSFNLYSDEMCIRDSSRPAG